MTICSKAPRLVSEFVTSPRSIWNDVPPLATVLGKLAHPQELDTLSDEGGVTTMLVAFVMASPGPKVSWTVAWWLVP